MSNPTPAPAKIPPPKDFPVHWSGPEEAALLWEMDRVHFVRPVPLLSQDFGMRLAEGFNAAAAAMDLPIRWRKKYINTYDYTATVPAVPLEQMEAQTQRALDKLEAAMQRLQDDWQSVHLPEIQQHLRFWESFDLGAAPMPALLEHLKQTVARHERLWKVHFLIVIPTYLAISQFDELFADLFPEQGPLQAYRLMQGFDNKTLEADRALWGLSQSARALPGVVRMIQSQPPAKLMAALQADPQAREFVSALHAFLDQYGKRSSQWSLEDVSWIEDPAPLLQTLKEYVHEPPQDPLKEMQKLAKERERFVSEAKDQLQGHPQPVRDAFDAQLTVAQQATVLSEDHGFWIDFRSMYHVRRVLMEFGRRFAEAGLLEAAGDVFCLRLEELQAAAGSWPPAAAKPMGMQAKAQLQRFSRIAPPPMLGTLPPGPPPDNPITRTLTKFFGGPLAPAADPAQTRLLQGNAGSTGVVRGPARVILSLDEADRLREGDILVTTTTAPPWTPLFAIAAAVVTDAGGVLCHCAVVAREYGIPAVVGTGYGTQRIRDGQMLEVDGGTGQVRLV